MARTIAKDHNEKRKQILKTAAKTFATEGFDRASMSHLARECGISKANIYHYYSGKEAILYDILETYLRELRDRICGLDTTGLNPEEQLRKIILEILLAYQGADHEHQVQIGSMSSLPPDQQSHLRSYQREMVQKLGDTIQHVSPASVSTDKVKLRRLTMSVFGMLNWYYMWSAGEGTKGRTEYAELVADFALHGIKGL